MTKNSFIVYHNYRDKLKSLSDAQLGKLFKAMLDYSITGKEPKLTGAVNMAFQFIKVTMDEDKQKYESVCKKNQENIKRRWNTTVYEPIPNDTKNTDNDYDNDYDNDFSLSINKKYIYLSTRVHACEKEQDIEKFLQEHFKSYFQYWGYDEKDKQTFYEVIHILANAIVRAKDNNLKFYLMRYDYDTLLKQIAVLDDEDIHKIVWQVLNNNEIRDRYLYILGALLSRASEKSLELGARYGKRNEKSKV